MVPEGGKELDNFSFGPSKVELLAASLRLNNSDIQSSMAALAAALQSFSPSGCEVKRKKRGFRSKQETIESISLHLGDETFTIENSGGSSGITCTRAKIVRGIVLKRDELTVDEWINSLAESLAVEAERTEKGRDAIARLLGMN